MEDAAIQDLAFKYRPIVYLHPGEKYLPMEFNQYVNESRLKNCKTGAIFKPDQVFDDVTFGQWLHDYPQINSQDYTLYLPHGMDSPCIAQYQPKTPELATVPLYVNYRTASNFDNGYHIYISYTFMYAYNGPEPVCCFSMGQHYADSEHVTCDVFVSRNGDVSFNQMYNSRHNGGVWIDGADLIWHAGRPLVFSSLNGHASYNVAGHHSRYWGVAIDRCGYGELWDTQTMAFLPKSWQDSDPRLRWTLFAGNLGDGHVDGFGNKSYLTQTDQDGEYGASTCPCSWKC